MSSISLDEEMPVNAGALDQPPPNQCGDAPLVATDLLVENCSPEIADARIYLAGMTHFFSDRA